MTNANTKKTEVVSASGIKDFLSWLATNTIVFQIELLEAGRGIYKTIGTCSHKAIKVNKVKYEAMGYKLSQGNGGTSDVQSSGSMSVCILVTFVIIIIFKCSAFYSVVK